MPWLTQSKAVHTEHLSSQLLRPCFALQVGQDAVVIEADAIKNRDVIYRSLEKMENLGSEANLSQYVHEYSTRAAESMLVTAGELPPRACCERICYPLQNAHGTLPCPAWCKAAGDAAALHHA